MKLTIDFSFLPLPCGDFVFKEQVDLAKCTVFGLWETEETPDDTEQVGACVEQTGFGAPVPCCRITKAVSLKID